MEIGQPPTVADEDLPTETFKRRHGFHRWRPLPLDQAEKTLGRVDLLVPPMAQVARLTESALSTL